MATTVPFSVVEPVALAVEDRQERVRHTDRLAGDNRNVGDDAGRGRNEFEPSCAFRRADRVQPALQGCQGEVRGDRFVLGFVSLLRGSQAKFVQLLRALIKMVHMVGHDALGFQLGAGGFVVGAVEQGDRFPGFHLHAGNDQRLQQDGIERADHRMGIAGRRDHRAEGAAAFDGSFLEHGGG